MNEVKILGIVGTPHGKFGNTHAMMEKLMEGAQKEGAETEMIMLSDLRINYCSGCGLCLSQGECPQKDDMKDIRNKMAEASGIVLGSPVYFLHVTAQMKTFIDRCLSLGHRPSLYGKYGASVSVFAGVGNVADVADYMNSVLRGFGVTPIGAVCGYAVKPGEVEDGVLDKCRALGRELALTIMGEKECNPVEADRGFLLFKRQMGALIEKERDFMRKDYEYWKEKGWL